MEELDVGGTVKMLEADLDHPLCYEKHAAEGRNWRNGKKQEAQEPE